MWRDAALVAGKDLRVEARSRVGLNQVAPFALFVLVVFAFALDSDRDTLTRVGPAWRITLVIDSCRIRYAVWSTALGNGTAGADRSSSTSSPASRAIAARSSA